MASSKSRLGPCKKRVQAERLIIIIVISMKGEALEDQVRITSTLKVRPTQNELCGPPLLGFRV